MLLSFISCFDPIIVLYIIFFIDFIPSGLFSLSKSKVINYSMQVFVNCFLWVCVCVIYQANSLASTGSNCHRLWMPCHNKFKASETRVSKR